MAHLQVNWAEINKNITVVQQFVQTYLSSPLQRFNAFLCCLLFWTTMGEKTTHKIFKIFMLY